MAESNNKTTQLLAKTQSLEREIRRMKQRQHRKKGIQKKQEENKDLYRNFFQLSNDCIIIHDLNGKIIEVNKKALNKLGYNKTELLKLNINDLHPQEVLSQAKAAFQKLQKDGFIQFEIEFRRKNGQIFPAEVSSSLFAVRSKKVVQNIVRDISQRKEAELKFKQLQIELNSIVRSVPDIIYRVNKRARITFISETIRNYGYTPEELIGKSIFSLIHPADREKAQWHVNERRTGDRRTKSFELRLITKNKHYVPFDVHAKDIVNEHVFLLEAEGLYKNEIPDSNAFLGSQGVARDITGRKISENALRESEEKFRSIVENSHAGIGIIDDNFHMIYINDKMVEILGYSITDIVGKDFRSLLDRKNREFLADRYIRRQKGEPIPDSYEISLKKKNGQNIIVELISAIIEDSEGRKRTIVQLLDITESKAAAKALAESENKFRQVFQNANDAIYLWEFKNNETIGKCIEVNDKACQMLGYTRDEFLQMTPADIDSHFKVKEIPQILKNLQKKKHFTFEMIHRTKNGQLVPVEISSHVFNLNGKKVILSITRDITERKKTEIALTESEKRFRMVFDTSALGMAIISPNGFFLQTNQAFREMVGYTEKELVELDFSQITYSADRKNSLKFFRKLNKGIAAHIGMENRYSRKDGKIVWGKVVASAIHDEEGKHLHNIAMVEDITERKRAEEALRDSETKLRSVINHAPLVLWAVDKKGIFTFSQGRGLASLGLKPDEVVGKSLYKIYKDNTQIICDVKRALKGESFNSVFNVKDIVFETLYSPLFDNKGKIIGASCISTDITHRKKSEAALERKTFQQEQLLETAKQLTSSLDLTEVLRHIAHGAKRMINACGCVIYLLEPDNNTLTPVVAVDPHYKKELMNTPITVQNSFTGRAIQEGRGVIFNDAGKDLTGFHIPGTPEEEEEHIIAAPFIIDNKAFGALCLNRIDKYYNAEDLAITETFATFASTAIKNARAHHDLQKEVDERKQAQLALIESEEKFRNLAEQSPNMIFINVDGRIVYANKKCEEMMGYSRKEFYSSDFDFRSIIIPESQPVINENFQKHAEGHDVPPYEYKLLKRNGEIIESLITTKLINYGGKRAILGIVTDIGEQKRAEEALKISEEKYRRFFEEDLTGDFIAASDGTLLACNSAFLRIFGFHSEEDAYHSNIAKLFPTPKRFADFIDLLTQEKLLEYHELELVRFDGKLVFVIANTIGKFNKNGELLEIIGYFFDDTERKILTEQFRQAQKMEAVGRLAGGVAHDFNNLLTIINGYSELILHRLEKNDPLTREIRQIKQAGEKATRLTNQLLAFSRRQVLQPRLLNLNSIVMDVDKILRRIIGEDIELIIYLDPDLGTIKADPGQIEQVLMNLAVNARDAMLNGGKLIVETDTITLNSDYHHKHLVVQPAGNYVRLSISDTGIGMDETTKAQIFEPFFTTKERGKGTGLGLSTVYGIIKQSEGFIWVDSKLGEGTTFQIYFPRVLEEPQELDSPSKVNKSYEGKETILLVEDETMVRELAADILREQGYHILEASRGEQALEKSKNYRGNIELMITDVVMPGMSGKELAKRLKIERPKMKILFISGYSDEVVTRKGTKQEKFEFLQKPFLPDKFLDCVRNLLDNKN